MKNQQRQNRGKSKAKSQGAHNQSRSVQKRSQKNAGKQLEQFEE